jgi:hypothetical protein
VKAARATLLAAGVAVILYAIIGVLTDDGTSPLNQLMFTLALVVAHDGIVLPLAIGVGVLIVRFVPDWARPPVQAGLYASLVLTIFTIPMLIGAGRLPDNPTILPLNYARGLQLVLAASWVAAAVWAGYRWRARQRIVAAPDPGPEPTA